MQIRVPFLDVGAAYQELKAELNAATQRVMASGQYILGPEVAAFESEFAAYCDSKFCIGVGNGLDALHLIFRAMEIGAGDEVIVPANTYIATWLAVSYAGATPVPVEPDEKTYNQDSSRIEEAITSRTKAIIAVHLYGQPADMDPINELADKYGLAVIEDARVIVSDNSTLSEDRDSLAKYCEGLNDSRLTYLRPPEPMQMSRHWDWALQQALQEKEVSHFSYLTDRMMFRPDSLKTIIDLVRQYPEMIICYMHDKVSDFRPPYGLDQHEWTGKLYEVSSKRLLSLSAKSVMYDGCVPRMLNCFVPRGTLDVVRMRFGSVFSPISPDWNFAYRALEVVDSLLYFHKALLVHYSLARSNGESVHRGNRNSAFAQFEKDLETPVIINAPYPEIITVWNGIINEYCSVKKEAQSQKFPELDMRKYAEALAWGIEAIEDPQFKQQMKQKLLARGWDPEIRPRQPSLASKLVSPRRILYKLRTLVNPITFDDADQALKYAVKHPRRKCKVVAWEEALHRGTEVPIQLA